MKKGSAILLLCAVALAHTAEVRLTKNGQPCNCNPNEAWQICDANWDRDDVIIAHPNCNQFYKCANGRPVVFSCSPGLLYNPYIEDCDWPQNVDCGDRPISGGQGVEEEDCDENEGDGAVDDSQENEGNADEGAVDEDCEDNGTDNEVSDNNGNDSVNVGGGNSDPSEAPAICAAEGSEDVLVSHENCNKFYICNGGTPVAMNCPGVLLFNPYTDQCDWPEKVECGDRLIPDPEDNDNEDGDNDGSDNSGSGSGDSDNGESEGDEDDSDNGDSDSDNGGGGTCNCNPGEAQEICAADGSDSVLIAHENCNQFYKCDRGEPVVFTCSGTLLYNPYTEQCDWPENIECGDRVIPDAEDNDNEDNDSGDSGGGDNEGSDNGESDNVGGGNCDPSEAPSICAADGSEDILVAHENCNQFYICNGGKPVALTCPGILLFNPDTDRCDWPGNVDCGDRVIPEGNDNGGSDNGGGDNGEGEGDNVGGDNGGGDNGGGDNGGGDNGGGDNGGGDNGGGDSDNVGGGNCDPSEAPTICAADGSEGVLVAHENCNQFYICNGGRPVTLTCPSNLLFNPNIDQCDWPFNVDCGDRIIPDSEDNNGGGDNGGDNNGGGDSGGSDNGGSDNGGEENGSGDNDGGDSNNVGGGNCDPSEAPTICAADDSESVLVAHENCNQFYICNGGKPVTLTCPSNLLFNPNTDQCDWPFNVDCGDRIIPDPEDNNGGGDNGGGDNGEGDNGGGDNGEGDNGGGDNGGGDNGGGDNGGTCNCNPGEATGICAADGSDGVLIAHENCNQFYKCAHGRPVAFTCYGNLLYNPYTEQCDWPENVECGDRVIPEPDDNDNNNGGDDNGSGNDNGGGDNGGGDNGGGDNGGGDNGGGDSDNVGGGNCDPSEAPAICATDGSEGVLVAHENCNQFYICNGGKPVTLTCPNNLLFNPNTDQCDWPFNVDCGDRIIPDPEDINGGGDNGGGDNGEGDNGGGDSGGGDNGGGDNDAGDNGGGDNGGGDNGSGDNGGTCNCNPGEAPEICAADGSEGALIAHENCNQFYKCSHGRPVALSCNENLLYNPYTEQCDWPENVECGDRVVPDPDDNDNNNGGDDNGGSDNGGGDNSGGDNGGGDNGEGDSDNVGGGNCDPSEAPAICATDGSEGVLVAHENCNQFYICNGGKPVTLTCPNNLLFNPNTDQCDWPFNVDCGDRIIPDSEDNNGEGDNGGGDNGGGDNGGGDNGGGDNGGGDNGGGDNGVGDNGGGDNGGEDNGGGDNVGGDNGGGDNGGTCNCNPGEAPEICAADGSEGALIAHENCNQFYKCSHGRPVALSCNENLLYNPYTEQCDWPENVACGDRVIPEIEDNDNDNGNGDNGGDDNGGGDNGGGDNGGGDNGGTCNCNPGEAPEICATDSSEGVLIAHENCNQFYKCSNGVPVALSCNENLLYNPYTEQCDWPQNVVCGDRVIPDSEDQETGSGDNEVNGGGDNGGADNGGSDNGGSDNGGSDNGGGDNEDSDNDIVIDIDDPSQAPSICAGAGSNGVLVAHENCDQYYTCSGGVPIAMSCSGDLLFNVDTQLCDWPRLVDCGDRIVPEADGCLCNPRQAPAICSSAHSDGLKIAHESCDQFFVCAGGMPIALSCPAGLNYNPRKEVCDWPINVDCEARVSRYSSLNKHTESRQTFRK